MKKLAAIIVAGIVVSALVLFAIGAWHLERKINWKYGYSEKIEPRLDAIERRLGDIDSRLLVIGQSRRDTLCYQVHENGMDSTSTIWKGAWE